MLKLGGQGAQVEHVDRSVDFSGFGARCARCSRCFGAAVAASIQDYSIGQYSSVFISIGQYCAVLASSFRIARCGRGRRAFTGNRAIRMAETEPLMQACYSFVKEHCSAGLNCLSGRLLGGSKRDNAQQRQNVKALAPKDLAESVTGPAAKIASMHVSIDAVHRTGD